MYSNSAFLSNPAVLGYKDKSRKLIVTSCGTYRLSTIPRLPTYRPHGRIDWQIIYISKGKAYFHFNSVENECIVNAGNLVIFQPKELQKYEYYGEDKTEVYWIHFTGSDVNNLLHKYRIPFVEHVFNIGISTDYDRIFHQMIQEMQKKRDGFEEMCTILLSHLLIITTRQIHMPQANISTNQIVEAACEYFGEHYNENISIETYADDIGLSPCWFIQKFKHSIGTTPMQYIMTLRISNAQNLLITTDYSVSEIASLTGYSNSLYFSRIFKQHVGCSPTQYRKNFSQEQSYI